jgi:hypothetical protein
MKNQRPRALQSARHTAFPIALILVALLNTSCQSALFGRQDEEKLTAAQQLKLSEKTVSMQQRINRYFHSEVVPKLKSCWTTLQGAGMIGIEYTYQRDTSGRWLWSKLAHSTSTLPSTQESIALQCMEQSVRGTSFPIEESDGAGDTFVVKWNWPVPFPTNADEQTRTMFAAKPAGGGGGTGGCDGKGTAPKCIPDNCPRGKCPIKSVCVGYAVCALRGGPEGGCDFRAPCASGGPFGVADGAVMY